eukprot:m.41533 g.41533  ORF g.41533 m.41533 type:complete len:205 (+) comp33201_c0_seq2:324-938(+)
MGEVGVGPMTEAMSPHKDGERKRRRRKRGRRKWKPYEQMTREEKEMYDEHQAKKAEKKQEELWRLGKPGAPFNTNRFLIEDHGTDEEVVVTGGANSGVVKRSISMESSFSDDFLESTSDDEALFIQTGEREFDEMYQRFHEEKLNNMSREELVKEVVDLERLLAIEKARTSCSSAANAPLDLEEEIEQLRKENEELRAMRNAKQ